MAGERESKTKQKNVLIFPFRAQLKSNGTMTQGELRAVKIFIMAYKLKERKCPVFCNDVTYCHIPFTLKQVKKFLNQTHFTNIMYRFFFIISSLGCLLPYKRTTTYINLYTIKVTNSYLQIFGKTLINFNSI